MSTLKEIQDKFMGEIAYVDDLSQIVLKGHLVMEELMTEAIGRFILHGNILPEVKLQFHQKLNLCRSMSVSDQDNPMWSLIIKINSLRNHLSHSLNNDDRSKRVQSLKSNFEQQFGKEPLAAIEKMDEDSAVCMLAINGCLGYLHSFLSEVKRFETMVNTLNTAMNKQNA